MTFSGEQEDKRHQDKAARRALRRQTGRKVREVKMQAPKMLHVRSAWKDGKPDTIVHFSRRPFSDRMRVTFFAMPTEEFERTFGVELPRGEFKVQVRVQARRFGRIRRPIYESQGRTNRWSA